MVNPFSSSCVSCHHIKVPFSILDGKQKIMLRELSFDDHADVAGTELLAPVFLAIAEENDDDTEIQGMRKRTLSIEDLCGVINEPGNKNNLLV